MRICAKLKKTNSNDNLLQKIFAAWCQHDPSLSLTLPVKGSPLVRFITNTGWEGVIDLIEWFTFVYPKQAVLAQSDLSTSQIYTLFLENKSKLIIPTNPIYSGLQYQELIFVELIGEDTQSVGLLSKHCFFFKTPRGKIWITALSKQHSPQLVLGSAPATLFDEQIPHIMQFHLGKSRVSLGLFKRLTIGDVLLIKDITNSVSLNKTVIGEFKIENEGIMLDIENLNLTEDDNDEHFFDEDYQSSQADVTEYIDYRKLIPVELTFVLATQQMKLAELEEMFAGHFMPIEQSCYKNIEIHANGFPVAKGEMVVLDENIGIEIKTIYGKSNCDDE